tara:strand:- start:3620 stop:5002 length:1383 start_codon:yes stop_codon:yes gene_type:complete
MAKEFHMIIGNPDATWEDIDCHHLADFGEDKICKLASDMAGVPAKIPNPYRCEICNWHKDGKTAACKTVQKLALKAAEESGENLLRSVSEKIGEGVGTELHKMIPKFLERPGCSCKSWAKKMNIWGVEGCTNNKQAIIDHLVAESNKRVLFSWVPSSATKVVAKRLVESAINKVREKEEADNPKTKWFCAVTTAPRKVSTLQNCVESLQIAGFTPFIFAEPNVRGLGKQYEEFTINNETKRGVWHNWLDSCRYALENSDANTILTVQDDSLFHPDSKTFLEQNILWPDTEVGFVSLYTPKHYSLKPHKKTEQRDRGVNRVITKSMWGACALVWPRKILEQVVELDFTKNWLGARLRTKSAWESMQEKRRAEPWRVQNSDTAIGKIMNIMGRTMWFCDPSPVQHIAEYSAISHGGNKGRRNCGRCATWSESLLEQIPRQNNGKRLYRYEYDEINLYNPNAG